MELQQVNLDSKETIKYYSHKFTGYMQFKWKRKELHAYMSDNYIRREHREEH